MNQKGFSKITLVIGAMAILAVAGLLVWNNKDNSSLSEQNNPTNSQESSLEIQVRNAVEKVLSQGKLANRNEQMPKGIKLLSLDVNENKVTLDFSEEITSKGRGVFEDLFSLISNAIHPIIQGDVINPKYSEVNLIVLVKGKLLSEIF